MSNSEGSMRAAVIKVQNDLNRKPLHVLGAMLVEADRLVRSDNPSDRAAGRILRKQVLLAMSPQFDSIREE